MIAFLQMSRMRPPSFLLYFLVIDYTGTKLGDERLYIASRNAQWTTVDVFHYEKKKKLM